MENIEKENKLEQLVGEIFKLKVVRTTQLGYVLSLIDENYEIFMHENDCKDKLKQNDEVEAFLFLDKKNRLAATTYLPYITKTKFDFVNVIDTFATGVFLDIGIKAKDVMLSKFDLPRDKNKWPQIDDKLPCVLSCSHNKLFGKVASKTIFQKDNETDFEVGSSKFAYVYRISDNGINLVDTDYNVYFVHKSNIDKPIRLGEHLEVVISKKNDSGYTCHFPKDKVNKIDANSMLVWNYLVKHHGEMSFTSKSSPDTIKKIFKMSKGDFKNALGHLYKERLIDLLDDKTIIVKK